MPVWASQYPESAGFSRISNENAIAKGLTFRPLAVTARDTLEWFKTLPAERQAKEKRFAELAKQFDQMRRNYLEELEVRKGEAHAQLLEQANAIIKTIAETEKFDLILQQAVYGSPQIDITDRVLAEMAKRNPAAEPAKQ